MTGTPVAAPPPPDLSGRRHALGEATDTAGHLAALVAGDAALRQAATEHLDAAIVPGGRPCPVSGDVAAYVSGLLRRDLVEHPTTRVELLYFLGQVTEAADAPPGEDDDGAVAGCRAVLAEILATAEHCERDTDPDVRVEAADTAESAVEVLERLGLA